VFSVVFAVVFISVAAVVILVAWWRAPNHKQAELDLETVAALVELHRIRRRFDVFLFKVEVERRTQRAERGLQRELHERRRP
jgi:hypothetical protein